jgi:hypothetical protein
MTPAGIAPALAATKSPVLNYWSTVDNPFPYPQPNRMVTVYGFFLSDSKPVKGVKMTTSWTDGTLHLTCDSHTDASGIGTCTHTIPNLQLGTSLQIVVTFYYKGGTYTSSSSALPT